MSYGNVIATVKCKFNWSRRQSNIIFTEANHNSRECNNRGVRLGCLKCYGPVPAANNKCRNGFSNVQQLLIIYWEFVVRNRPKIRFYSNFADDVQGMCTPLVGTTLVHMEQLFNADTATMSWTFTMSSIGYFFGAIACGFIFDRINHELQLIVANFIEAVTTVVAPFFTSLPLYITALFIQANCQGFIDASKVWLSSEFH